MRFHFVCFLQVLVHVKGLERLISNSVTQNAFMHLHIVCLYSR